MPKSICPKNFNRGHILPRGAIHYPKGESTSPLGFSVLTLRGKLHMPPYESAMGSMADSPVATTLLAERITGRVGVSPAQMED